MRTPATVAGWSGRIPAFLRPWLSRESAGLNSSCAAREVFEIGHRQVAVFASIQELDRKLMILLCARGCPLLGNAAFVSPRPYGIRKLRPGPGNQSA